MGTCVTPGEVDGRSLGDLIKAKVRPVIVWHSLLQCLSTTLLESRWHLFSLCWHVLINMVHALLHVIIHILFGVTVAVFNWNLKNSIL